ncbi:uncharacterized protein LOC141591506 isoform X2 [Silene latifolia]|uniref:uncharacterized protein LOC141591506 isoform X2 n=1 Tax=Silene latifolia TaxID=37657 RepID=UPI003D780489
MKLVKKLVKDLMLKTGPYSIKVKVINKAKAQTSSNKKTLTYQRITFEDEEMYWAFIYVEKVRQVTSQSGEPLKVPEIVIVDHSDDNNSLGRPSK